MATYNHQDLRQPVVFACAQTHIEYFLKYLMKDLNYLVSPEHQHFIHNAIQ